MTADVPAQTPSVWAWVALKEKPGTLTQTPCAAGREYATYVAWVPGCHRDTQRHHAPRLHEAQVADHRYNKGVDQERQSIWPVTELVSILERVVSGADPTSDKQEQRNNARR